MTGTVSRVRRAWAVLAAAALTITSAVVLAPAASAADPVFSLVGSLQDDLGVGCGEWDPGCTGSDLAPVAGSATQHEATFTVPGGTHEFKIVTDHSWDNPSYGAGGGEANIPLVLAGETRLRFVFDTETHRTAVIPVDLAADVADDAVPANTAEPVRDPGGDEQFYFVMTDRFEDGDPDNNTGGLTGDALTTGYDPTNKGFFLGGDIAGLHSQLDYIEGLGTTAIWLTPSFENRPVQGEGDLASAGYHGYWITDFTQIDPHLGTNAELEALIDDAHARGMKVYFDIITNHTADVIDYEGGLRDYVPIATSPYRDAGGDVIDIAALAGSPAFPDLDAAISFPYLPVVDPAEAELKVPGWLNDVTLYHNRGNSTWSGESVTLGDFDGLDDLMTEDPEVVEGFIEIYKAWMDLGIDGFRIDTVKHVNLEFWQAWTEAIEAYADEIDNPDFFAFGEVFDADPALLAPYVRTTDMDAVLDFAYQSAASSFARGLSARGLANLFAGDDRYTTPTSSAADLPTFLGNHDMGRIGYFLASATQPAERSALAHSLMYLTRGQPVVYYGDEQGFAGPGGDKDARQTMFPTQVQEYADQSLLDGTPVGTGAHFDTDAALYAHIAGLAALRSTHPALATGAQLEQHATDGPGIYAFSRVDAEADAPVEYLVAVNNTASEQTASFTALTPDATFAGIFGTDGDVASIGDGTVSVTVPALTAVVYQAGSPLPERASGIDATFAGVPGAPVAAMNPVAVTLAEEAYAETTFAYRVAGAGDWVPLGTSDRGAPRVFHDTAGLAAGTLVEYRAVVADVSGNLTATSTYASVGDAYGPGSSGDDPATRVTIPGSHGTEFGCGAWEPGCAASALTQRENGSYAGTFTVTAGSYEYKVAIGTSWDVNYGVDGEPDGPNIAYTHAGGPITFYYDPETHRAPNTALGPVASLAGSFQQALGCTDNWSATCLGALLSPSTTDPGTATFSTSAIPPGSYEVKVVHGLDWSENYGAGGAADGPNIPFTVTADEPQVTFSYDYSSHVLTVTAGEGGEEPEPELLVTVPGSHNTAMGCAGDWDPACLEAVLTRRPDGVYSATFDIPAGSYEYKVAIGGSWSENYGAGGVPGGDNIAYTHAGGPITFFYDHGTNIVTSTAEGPIITAAGSFQSEIGCPGDWQPECLRSWLVPRGGTTFVFETDAIPPGSYEVKAAYNLDWTESYPASNVPFVVPDGEAQVVRFTFDSATKELTVTMENPPLAGQGQLRAHWLDQTTLAWPFTLRPEGSALNDLEWVLYTAPEGGIGVTDGAVTGADATPLTLDVAGLSPEILERFPALDTYVALTTPALDRAQVEALLTGELQVGLHDADGELVALTGVQIPGVLDDLYAADAADRDLGITWAGDTPSFAVWAPTAKDVDLLLWEDGAAGDPERIQAERQADGSWTVQGEAGWENAAYRYDVEVFVTSTGEVENNLVTDPYSVALTLNSTHSVVVDLDDPDLAPQEWVDTPSPVIEDPVDRSIYELHVRDFSIGDTSIPEAIRGTYLAFDADGAGADHLRTLAEAGLTTVHLLPTFDIATIQEDRALQEEPEGDLASFPPDSTEQQARVRAVADRDGFNWGYDPLHFQAPEGSYASDPHGGARVAEFRTMVGALHETGLEVVLDQVYNHTSASGQADTSILDRVVPGYYHRLNDVGAVETSTCCQNVATEHELAEKLMVDSVVLWAREYKVDGFRFDLMGHHSRDNMLAVRAALDELTLAEDGIDGSRIYLYGEGWNFGEVANDRLFVQARQGNLGGTGIGTFTDRLRDAVHGGGPFDENPRIQGFGTGLLTDPNGDPVNGTPEEQAARLAHLTDLVRLGLAGNLRDFTFLTASGEVQRGDQLDYNGQPAGYADEPDEIVTYVDAHDNETLFDLLAYKLPQATSMADRIRMNTLSLATAALSQTPSFWHAGTDLLRSKSLDRNSYNSGDWFNVLDFTGQVNGFARGLPPEPDNASKWPFAQPLLADPALVPTPEQIAQATAAGQELLRIRATTDLLRLGSAELIRQKVTFPGSGPDAAPGVIVMAIDDLLGEDADPTLDGALVVFNAGVEATTQTVAAFAGRDLALSPIQAGGADPVVLQTTWAAATGTVTVPARTVAVLLDPEGLAESTITLEPASQDVAVGATASLTATVTAAGAVPTGVVELVERGRVIATGELDDEGTVTFEVPAAERPGTRTLTARYTGSDEASPATSDPVTIRVVKAASTTTLAPPSQTVRVGERPAVTVTVTAEGVRPTGRVVILDGSRQVATGTLDRHGRVTLKLPARDEPGTRTLTARYQGSTLLAPSTSNPVTVTVVKATSRVSVRPAQQTVKVGRDARVAVTVTAHGVVPTGTVRLVENGRVLDSATLHWWSGGTAILEVPKSSRPGTRTLTVVYSGSDAVQGATSSPVTVRVIR